MSQVVTWADHACRHCLGRLLQRRDDAEGARSTYECGTCGVTCKGEARGICGCGIMPKPVRDLGGPRFFCTANPARSVTSPAAITIAFAEGAPA